MAADNIVFLKEWYNELINDEFSPLTAEECAYILYAAAMYSWDGEKTNFDEVFGRKDLNRVMAPYYAQMDRVLSFRKNAGSKNTAKGNQSFDNEAIKPLAAQGMSQKDICKTLGYDEARSRSLSSNKGYREGREIYLKNKNGEKSEIVSSDKNESEVIRNESDLFGF